VGSPAPRAPLDKAMITSGISPYWRVSVVELTGSTQDDLANLISLEEVNAGELIVTEFQSAGRGRLDRSFQAPAHSALLFSFYLKPKRVRDDWGFISMLAALTLTQSINKSLSKDLSLKWPNDILIGDKKVAGLISQATEHGVIVGIGLNVGMDESELPVETATSLLLANSEDLDRNKILINFLNLFEINFKSWDSGADFRQAYSSLSSTLKKLIQIEVVGKPVHQGLAKSITLQGTLMLDDGSEVTVGDVVHLR
jgi:BirA family biotin operon repressor/biotin-[acetyl-CoA-carboxylase] ligase